jgi:hypothetical protein
LTTTTPVLHVPDEPTVKAAAWRDAVYAGAAIASVLCEDDGLVAWLWYRWSTLERAGLTKESFTTLVLGYQRELWLWLAGERTWAHACSGLVGRINRRVGQVDSTGA